MEEIFEELGFEDGEALGVFGADHPPEVSYRKKTITTRKRIRKIDNTLQKRK